MSINSLEEARLKLAEIRTSIESAHMTVELLPGEDSVEYLKSKAGALQQLQQVLEGIELLAAGLGGISPPVRH